MELYEIPMIEVSEKIRTKEVSPVEVTQSSLARLEEVEPTLTAFATTTPELALEQIGRCDDVAHEGGHAERRARRGADRRNLAHLGTSPRTTQRRRMRRCWPMS